MRYDHQSIEKRWQARWEKDGIFRADDKSKKPKYFSLETFPYPSAQGLHVGHPSGYAAEDVHARYRRMKGFEVLYTMGWDAFGLPTENYAIKIGKNPKEVAAANIANFTRQVKMFGFSYDWEREINTSDPTYYRWTQWLFIQMFKKGLAYRAKAPVNWCPSCQTVLANEQVVEGTCERCHSVVVQREMEQWFLKITPYAERLLAGLDGLDWPEATKTGQKNWIGKKEGINITYRIDGSDEKIICFTTRPDTNFGATFIVLAPEHPFSRKAADSVPKVAQYLAIALRKTERERQADGRKKTGAFTGFYAINDLNGKRLPVWVSDFVLGTFGSGAVVGVPGHDKRDFEFAQTFGLPIVRVVVAKDGDSGPIDRLEQVQEEEGTMVNSEFLDGLDIREATRRIMDHLEKKGWGKRVTTYRLRDWLVSRQRYWGCPIPMIECSKCGWVPVSEKDLPVVLPDDVDFRPKGEPPLASSPSFVNTKCPTCKGPAKRATETLDTFVDSSWYFFRYCDATNDRAFASKEKIARWMPVDLYIIGAEHTVLHLLYARFFTKVLHELGYTSFDEPFQKLRHIGLILGEDGQKMSKSRGNVVNPDEIVERFGADATRLYVLFMGALEDYKPWNTASISGVRRFLERIVGFAEKVSDEKPDVETTRLLHKTIKKVGADIEALKFNTAIAQMMMFVNHLGTLKTVPRDVMKPFVAILAPFAPHIAEEVHEKICKEKQLVSVAPWPEYDRALAKDETLKLVVQVNGKVRDTVEVSSDSDEDEQKAVALASEKVKHWTTDAEISKVVVVPGRLVNIVTKP